jgi:hypothetical protein
VTVVAPGIDRGWDRRDTPRDPQEGAVTEDDVATVRRILGSYFNVDVGDGIDSLKRDGGREPPPPYIPRFRRGLQRTLRDRPITHDELEDLTHRAFDTDEEARAFLQRIWDEVFA